MKRSRLDRLFLRRRVHTKRQRLRDRLSGRWARVVLSISGLGLVATLIFLFIAHQGRGNGMSRARWPSDVLPPAPVAVLIGSESSANNNNRSQLMIPVADLPENAVRHFDYRSPSLGSIRFFVVRRKPDDVVVALDACRGCYFAGAGVVQVRDRISCRNCGYSAAIKDLDGIDHECRPIPIAAVLDGSTLRIQTAALEAVYHVFKADP